MQGSKYPIAALLVLAAAAIRPAYVAIAVSGRGLAPADSALIFEALKTGLESDSTVRVAHRGDDSPAVRGPGARHIVMVQAFAADSSRLHLRITLVSSETGIIIARDSVVVHRGHGGKPLSDLGRRFAGLVGSASASPHQGAWRPAP